jgi:hypothetical protein
MHEHSTRRGRHRALAAAGLAAAATLITTACGATAPASSASSAPFGTTQSSGDPGKAVEADINAILNLDSGSEGSQLAAECSALRSDAGQAVGHPLSAAQLSLSQWNALMADLSAQAGTCVTSIGSGDQPAADQAQANIIGDGNEVAGSG